MKLFKKKIIAPPIPSLLVLSLILITTISILFCSCPSKSKSLDFSFTVYVVYFEGNAPQDYKTLIYLDKTYKVYDAYENKSDAQFKQYTLKAKGYNVSILTIKNESYHLNSYYAQTHADNYLKILDGIYSCFLLVEKQADINLVKDILTRCNNLVTGGYFFNHLTSILDNLNDGIKDDYCQLKFLLLELLVNNNLY